MTDTKVMQVHNMGCDEQRLWDAVFLETRGPLGAENAANAATLAVHTRRKAAGLNPETGNEVGASSLAADTESPRQGNAAGPMSPEQAAEIASRIEAGLFDTSLLSEEGRRAVEVAKEKAKVDRFMEALGRTVEPVAEVQARGQVHGGVLTVRLPVEDMVRVSRGDAGLRITIDSVEEAQEPHDPGPMSDDKATLIANGFFDADYVRALESKDARWWAETLRRYWQPDAKTRRDLAATRKELFELRQRLADLITPAPTEKA